MRIEVEPQALIDAGKGVGSLGTQIGALSDAMGEALADGIASGTDSAGLNFGISYGRQADQFGKELAKLANAFKSVGLMLEATGFNYSSADAASTAGGPGPSGGISGEQSETKAGDAPYAPNGNIVAPPQKWWTIQPFLNAIPGLGAIAGIALTWPTGNAAMMNLTAAQWANIARGLAVFGPSLTSAAAAAGAQEIPEVEQIKKAFKDLADGADKLAEFADKMANTIKDFARGVQETQDAIRAILDRLSLDGLWDTVKGIFSGDGLNELRKIANEIGDVLGNFQDQIKGVLGLLEELKTLLGEAADSFQKWIRPVLVQTFGEQTGNMLADGIKLYTDIQVGALTGVIGLVSGTVALADPDTWKGLAETAIMLAQDPTKLDDVVIAAGSEFLALDKITGDNPGRGIGEAGFNIASLFMPGGALAKGGSVAKGLAATRHLLEGGGLERLGRLPGLGGHRTPDVPELPDAPAAPHIPEFTPPEGIPGQVLGPHGSGGPTGSSPTSPPSPSSSGPGSGGGGTPSSPPPHSSGPSQTGGGAAGGGSSNGGPAPVGGSPNGDGGSPSNGPVPTGGSPSSGGGDAPGNPSSNGSGSSHPGGSPVSPSMSPSGESPGSGGPSKPGGDGPSKSSGGGGSGSAGGETNPGADRGNGAAEPQTSSRSPEVDGSSNHPAEDRAGVSENDDKSAVPGDREQHGADSSAADSTDRPTDGAAPGSDGGEHSSGPVAGLSDQVRDEIIAMERGSRPDPSEYLSQEYIDSHLERFDQGGTRFMLNDSYEAYGIGQRDGTTFLFPTSEIDDLMAQTGGDHAALERALGLPEGYLNDSAIRVDIPDLRDYDLRVPSGNEAGANDQWLPGGFLPQGMPEAVIDGADVPPDDLTITGLSDPEGVE